MIPSGSIQISQGGPVIPSVSFQISQSGQVIPSGSTPSNQTFQSNNITYSQPGPVFQPDSTSSNQADQVFQPSPIPSSQNSGQVVIPLNGGKTKAYTYEAFFASDGRSKKGVSASSEVTADPGVKPKYTCSECGKHYATSSNLSRYNSFIKNVNVSTSHQKLRDSGIFLSSTIIYE